MPKFRVRSSTGVDLDAFDLDDLSEATLISATPTSFELLYDGDEIARFSGDFVYGDGPDALPTSGTITGFALIDDGKTEFALSNLSVSLEQLLTAMTEDAAEDAAEAAADALLDLFDVDHFAEGAVVFAGSGAFTVAWGAETATFFGSFTYGAGDLPVSGTITGFQFAEEGEVERQLTGLSVDLEDLLAAMAMDEGEDEDEDFSLFEGLFAGHDRLKGSRSDDTLNGYAGRDKLKGGDGNDALDGGDGRDKLVGQGGDDILTGGAGRDMLFGGAGADVFDFNDVSDSFRGRNKDKIRDFRGDDVIDLSDIDADTGTDGDQAFTLVFGGFSGVAGELAFRNNKLLADVDGDGRADFLVTVQGVHSFEVDDFLL